MTATLPPPPCPSSATPAPAGPAGVAGPVGAAGPGEAAGPAEKPYRRVRREPTWWRDAVGAATWASGLVVLGLWISDRGVTSLGSVAPGLTSLGQLSGLLAADLLLIQGLLMARIPIVERVYGQDELVRRHRIVGFTSFTLMIAHIILITLGYAAADRINPLSQLWDFVANYRFILLATAGTLLLVMVTVTSIRRARARVRYESWHLLHLYSYLGIGLAVPHQLVTGQAFNGQWAASLYWKALWIAAAGAVLVWRVGVPVSRSLRHGLRVTAVVEEGPGVVSVWMRGSRLDRLPVAAGQFFTWRFLTGEGWTRGHPYSLSAAPAGDSLRITVKDLGDGSRALAGVRPGTRVLIEGPYGRLHAGVRTRRKVALLAGGIGITPLRALLEDLPQSPGDVTLVYRASQASDLVLRDELDRIAADRGARVFYVVGPRSTQRSSWLPRTAGQLSDVSALRELIPDIAEHDVFLCGAQSWMLALRRALRDAGVPRDHIHSERFGW